MVLANNREVVWLLRNNNKMQMQKPTEITHVKIKMTPLL